MTKDMGRLGNVLIGLAVAAILFAIISLKDLAVASEFHDRTIVFVTVITLLLFAIAFELLALYLKK